MSKARVSYEFPCELSEKQIEADFASWLGYLSSFLGEYRLLDVNEQATGADKKLPLDGIAYYLQFKKPTALRPLSKTTKHTKREDPRRAIQRYRHENNLDQAPHSVCFQLRAKATGATDLQHNVLKKLDQSSGCRGLYVCPLEYSSQAYLSTLRDDTFHDWFYWSPRGRWLLDAGTQHVVRAAETSAFLRGHAAIQPHTVATDHNHYYSFSAQATDLVFHSPELVATGPNRLSDYLAAELRRLGEERWPSVDELAASRVELASELGFDQSEGETATDRLLSFGRSLHQRHQIRQVLLLRPTERGNK